MTPEDIDRVSKIFLAAQGPEGNGEDWNIETSKGYVQKHFGEYSIVAEHNSSVVGFCLAEKEPIESGNELLIQMVAVNPEVQKNGIGRLLWQSVISEAESSGLFGVRLLANKNHYSYKWYKNIGLDDTGYVEMNMNFEQKK